MKTNVAPESIESYNKVVNSGSKDSQHILIKQILIENKNIPMTRSEIAAEMAEEKSTVAGRVRELIDSGELEKAGTTKDHDTNRTVGMVRLVQ